MKNLVFVVSSQHDDGRKLKPKMIFKRKTMPKIWFPFDVFVYIHQKRQIDDIGIKLWIKNVWTQRPGALKKTKESAGLEYVFLYSFCDTNMFFF